MQPLRQFLCIISVLVLALNEGKATDLREIHHFNRDWKFLLGDHPGAEKTTFDDNGWNAVGLPHSFSIPYFMQPDFYTGYGWYRKTFNAPASWLGKQISLEFEAAFQETEIFVNGEKAGSHRGGYTGFPINITKFVREGNNLIAVRLNNLWQADLAPRAGDHTFSGGLYRDVNLVITNPLHITWYGTCVTTPTLATNAGSASTVRIQTELRNDSSLTKNAHVRTDILDAAGTIVTSVDSTISVPAAGQVTLDQTTNPIAKPQLWCPQNPTLYRAVTHVADGPTPVDQTESSFGFRWLEWSTERGFFLNGKHTYLRGANVHQDQAGWGDAVTNAALERDVRMVKEAGFNFIRGSHYPKDPAFADACDRHGIMWLSENNFWGMGGAHQDGNWNASAYPVTPTDEANFDQSVLDSLRAMIRIHRNHPSIITWSMCNEAFFSDAPISKIQSLLQRSVALAHQLDPTRQVTIGGAQRPLNQDRIDRIGEIAGYNGDGANQPAFQNPGVASMVSEYGSVTCDRPGAFEPGWGDPLQSQLANGRPSPFPWRAGEAIWCMFDHGSHGGLGLARMGIVDYFRIPKRAFFWYRQHYGGIAAPASPIVGHATHIHLTADKSTIASTDGTDDLQLSINLLDKDDHLVNEALPVTLRILSGPGEFPTGQAITFTPPGQGDASDIAIRDGQAAIAFRSYQAGTTRIRASSPHLPDTELNIRTIGSPIYQAGITPAVAAHPYARIQKSEHQATPPSPDVLGLNRPTKATFSDPTLPSAFANDGNPTTIWRANHPNASWEVFLEASYDVQRITLIFPAQANFRYTIDVASDNQPWRTVIDQSDTTRTDQRRMHVGDFGNHLTSIRVRFTATTPMPALAEVQIGGIPANQGKPLSGKLVGTVIGTPGSYANNPLTTREAAMDDRLDTHFDAPSLNGAWTGLDLGPQSTSRVTAIAYAPRFQAGNSTFPSRMIGGLFQGANSADFHDAVDLIRITQAPQPATLTTVPVTTTNHYRYLRYLSPDGGSGNASEIHFIGHP